MIPQRDLNSILELIKACQFAFLHFTDFIVAIKNNYVS